MQKRGQMSQNTFHLFRASSLSELSKQMQFSNPATAGSWIKPLKAPYNNTTHIFLKAGNEDGSSEHSFDLRLAKATFPIEERIRGGRGL